jgi:DNA ligase (NAD+)
MDDKEIKLTLKLCVKADDAYYNWSKENNKHLLADKDYDIFKDELEKSVKSIQDEVLKKKVKKYLKSVGSKVRKSKRDTVLPFMIGSLAKVTKDKLSKLKSLMKMVTKPDYIVGPKIDGTSLTLKYSYIKMSERHELIDALSRGDGKVGQSKLSHLSNVKGVPIKISEDFINFQEHPEFFIRGELVIFTKDFEKIKGDDYKEARNSCSGWINSDEEDSTISRIARFIPYELLDKNGEPLITNKIKTKAQASTFMNSIFKDKYEFEHLKDDVTDINYIVKNLETGLVKKEKLPYVTDGLVIEVNSYAIRKVLNQGNTGKYPKFAVAYKQSADEAVKTEGVKTKVTEITRTVNKAGLNFPTINYKPIVIGNSNFTKASGVHYAHICNNGFEKGSKISVVKAGGVIPKAYLLDKPKKIKPPKKCLCGAKAIQVQGGKPEIWNLYCSKPHKCKFAKQDNLASTLKSLKLTGLGKVNIQKLFDAGFTDIFELLEAKEKKLLKIEGFGESIITTIKTGIPQKLKEMDEAKLMDCSGVFIKPGLSLAEKTLEEVVSGKTNKGERYDLYLEKEKDFKQWKKKLKTYL